MFVGEQLDSSGNRAGSDRFEPRVRQQHCQTGTRRLIVVDNQNLSLHRSLTYRRARRSPGLVCEGTRVTSHPVEVEDAETVPP